MLNLRPGVASAEGLGCDNSWLWRSVPVSMETTPRLTPLVNRCQHGRPRSLANCQSLSATMEGGDTALNTFLGKSVGILKVRWAVNYDGVSSPCHGLCLINCLRPSGPKEGRVLKRNLSCHSWNRYKPMTTIKYYYSSWSCSLICLSLSSLHWLIIHFTSFLYSLYRKEISTLEHDSVSVYNGVPLLPDLSQVRETNRLTASWR